MTYNIKVILMTIPYPFFAILDAHFVVEDMYLSHTMLVTIIIVWSLVLGDLKISKE